MSGVSGASEAVANRSVMRQTKEVGFAVVGQKMTADLDQIFQPFRRLHVWESIQGTGLGLSICRKIVENHGGEIWAESVPGAGATFHFTLKKPRSGVKTGE